MFELTPAEQSRLTRAPSVNPEAYDAYLKGRYYFNRPSDENLKKAIARLRRGDRARSDLRPGPLGAVGRLPLGRLQRRIPDRLGGAAQGEGRRRKGHPARRPVGRGARLAGHVQAVLRIRLGRLRARVSPGVCAQPELRVRPRPVWPGARLPGTARRGDCRGPARRRARPAVPASPARPLWRLPGKASIKRRKSRRAADLDPTFSFPLGGWVDRPPGREGQGRHPAVPEGQGHGIAGVRLRMARVR